MVLKIRFVLWEIYFQLIKEIIRAVKTQTLKSEGLTKMNTNVDRKCYQTSAGAKVKDLTNLFQRIPET